MKFGIKVRDYFIFPAVSKWLPLFGSFLQLQALSDATVHGTTSITKLYSSTKILH